MNQNQLGDNIARYRKEKGLSQEKVAEYMEASRQAVTKWENNISRPSSENLIKLAEFFGVSMDELLRGESAEMCSEIYNNVNQEENDKPAKKVNQEENDKPAKKVYLEENDKPAKKVNQEENANNKTSWSFSGVSVACLIFYIIVGVLQKNLEAGVLICMFLAIFPVQIFLHIYFNNAIKNDSYGGIAGYDENVAYNYCELKKLLLDIMMHIEIASTVYVFLLCVFNCFDLGIAWINGVLLGGYVINFIAGILINNYRAMDKIYINQADKNMARYNLPLTIVYIAVLIFGVVSLAVIFEMKGIENNTAPAMKLCGVFLLGIIIETIGYFYESGQIKKSGMNDAEMKAGKMHKFGLICMGICLILYGIMWII
ncbi:MAG: helix-turn-helix transcriptional regulator [Agathobacter sp.]|nr:helix-turn-helix transcriptional regulator [Agathobacter sp.]